MTEHRKLLKAIIVWIFLIRLSPVVNGLSPQDPVNGELTGGDDRSTKSYIELAALEHQRMPDGVIDPNLDAPPNFEHHDDLQMNQGNTKNLSEEKDEDIMPYEETLPLHLRHENYESDEAEIYVDGLSDLASDTKSRLLTKTSANFAEFPPLACNADLDSADCSAALISSKYPTPGLTTVINIPCGQCYEWDLDGEVAVKGLQITGKLKFPMNFQTTIKTTYVVVKGELEITANHTSVGPDFETVKFVLTGTTDISVNLPRKDGTTGAVNIGVKPFLVAGGKLNIQGLPDSCRTWTRVKGKVLKTPEKDPSDFPYFSELPEECPVSGLHLINEDFSTGIGNFTGEKGGVLLYDENEGSMTVTNRRYSWQGPVIDYTVLQPAACLYPFTEYIFTIRLRLDMADGSSDGLPTTCKAGTDWSTGCLRLYSNIGYVPSGNSWREIGRVSKHYAGNYGEYVDFHGKVTFSGEELTPDNGYFLFYLREVEAGVDVTLDSFQFSLPSASSFPDENDVCGELVMNGDAEGNGFNPYPFEATHWKERMMIVEENGNKFFRLSNRYYNWSSFYVKLEKMCLDKGVTYSMSLKVRIHYDYDLSYYVYVHGQKTDNKWFDRRILECPGQSINDGWVTCSGEFIVDEDMYGDNLNYIDLRMGLFNTGDGITADIDYDDISISFARGYVDELIVDSDDVSCWAEGADVLVTSSTFYNWDYGVRKNGYMGALGHVNATLSGTTHIQLLDAPVIPIITEEENLDYAVEVALLSRNVKIEGDVDEVANKKGAYAQIMHTTGVTQVVEGVEFRYMGRLKEEDRFGLQIQYTGSIEGSSISRNSFRDSYQRCLSIEGSSNITVTGNIAHNVGGHCFFNGYKASDNTYLNNLASEIYGVGYGNRLDSQSDYDPGCFVNMYSPNSYIGNVASAGGLYGFRFYRHYQELDESYANTGEGNPRIYPMGIFRSNIAHSNSYYGMLFEHFEQTDDILFEDLKSYKNRYHGFYTYNGRLMTIKNSLFGENGYGLELKWCDDVNIIDVVFRGISTLTREITKPPHFTKRCQWSNFYAPIGYRMQTDIFRWDDATTLNQGARLENVVFYEFDHADDECVGSVPIAFNTNDKRIEGHFDYTSSFRNVTQGDDDKFMIDFCTIDKGVEHNIITDIDGSSDPLRLATSPSQLVSNTASMKAFAGSDCTEYDCGAYCRNICMRSVTVHVDQSFTQEYTLQVTRSDGKQAFVSQSYPYDDPAAIDNLQYEWNTRRFSLPLPDGEYEAQFLDGNGVVAWPKFALQYWDAKPDCEGYASRSNLTFVEPTPVCDELVVNGDFEDGTFMWMHRNGGLEAVPGKGVGGSQALEYSRRNHFYNGVGQNIDTRCLHRNLNQFYEIKAWTKLELNDENWVCTPFNGDRLVNCPSFTFKVMKHYDNKIPDYTGEYPGDKATVTIPYKSNQFNLIHGVFKVDSYLQSAEQVWFYLEKVREDVDIILDDVSIRPLDTMSVCKDNLIRNGDFETGNSMYWTRNGNPILDIITQGNGNHALLASNRGNHNWSASQELAVSCLVVNSRYKVTARYKLQNTSTLQYSRCDQTAADPNLTCMRATLYSAKPNADSRWLNVANVIATSTNDGWDYMSGIYTVEPYQIGHSRLYLYFEGVNIVNNILFDDIKIEPISFTCQNLVLNGDFEDGTTSLWSISDRTRLKYKLQSPGAGGSSMSLVLYDHTSWHISLFQQLDTRCIIEGQIFEIKAKFRLLALSDMSTGLDCDPSLHSSSSSACPGVRLYFFNCDGDSQDLFFWNDIDFFVWNKDTFNNFNYEFPVTSNMASCKNVEVHIGRYLAADRALIVDDFQIIQKTTLPPTTPPTMIPTAGEPLEPTEQPIKLTMPPTTEAVDCPSVGSDAQELTGSSVTVHFASANTLCTIQIIVTENGVSRVVPLARSYDANPWEAVASEVSISSFYDDEIVCYDLGCRIPLPALAENFAYYLKAYSYTMSEREVMARFLETSTFGVTRNDLNSILSLPDDDQIVMWLQDQMDEESVGISSHREFWRRQANPRILAPRQPGIHDRPCSATSRWRRYSFSVPEVDTWWLTKTISVTGSGPYIIKYNGQYRTVVDDFSVMDNSYASYIFNSTLEYALCGGSDSTDGVIRLRLGDVANTPCVSVRNPGVNFTNYENLPTYIVDIPASSLEPIDAGYYVEDEDFMLVTDLEDSECASIPTVLDLGDAAVFGKVDDGSWLIFDPHLSLLDNTLETPLSDGGQSQELVSGGKALCSNAPRTFLNEDTCVLSSNACGSNSINNEIEIELVETTLRELYNITGRYVYGIKGLPVIDQFNNRLEHPCTPKLRSRWEKKDAADCNPTILMDGTQMSLKQLLSSSKDSNQYIRDIYYPESGWVAEGLRCNSTDYNPEIEMIVEGTCYARVHPDYMSIYDMTYWSQEDKHPGNMVAAAEGEPNPIKKWADGGSVFLVFPSKHPEGNGLDHPMTRWDNNNFKFPFVGRYGDMMKLRDLPNELRLDAVAQFYQSQQNLDVSGVLVCGSPGEVASDKSLGYVFDVETGFGVTNRYDIGNNREYVFMMLALSAQDQLRQRVAWALAQIIVVVKNAIGSEFGHSEWFLQYHDIFVRNAFGNYRDILREISYNPLMAENLSFLRSRSSAYVWERYKIKAYADENFAREIMQLFSIGVIMLKKDGTPKLDATGKTILTYTNEDIMSFSRVWTGFDLQPNRGNIDSGSNYIDPMRIQASWRDRFPKTDLNGGYIGDYFYPLCEELPTQMFLRVGAKYRFLGSSNLPDLMEDPVAFATDNTIKRFILDDTSKLKSFICNKGSNGQCQYQSSVTLTSDLSCTGIECDVESVRVIQVAPSTYYEYVPPPCVHQVFYNNPKKISPRYRYYSVMCANPALPVASEACCDFASTHAVRNNIYDGERMTFSSAGDRCSKVSKQLCDFNEVGDWYEGNKNYNYFWTKDPCILRVKIDKKGLVTVVHFPSDYTKKVSHVNDDNENWFKVHWDTGSFPMLSNECDGVCEPIPSETACLCNTATSKARVFSSMPMSIDDVLSKLKVGSLNPNMLAPGTYTSVTDSETQITAHLKGGTFDTETIFEFNDRKGRTYFLKNVKETVLVKGITGSFTGYSFRNMPQFMSFVPSETNIRDAQYETEAALDHYFYHDNTAPFISSRLIQRLTTSNPSPRYVEAVADAFETGRYAQGSYSFGSGSYGDLAATIAAIYLDREARTTVLDKDPSFGSLREPLLKLLALMRSMEYISNKPIIRMDGLETKIGQAPHEFPSVFSFFLPEFKPYGRVGYGGLVSPEATTLNMPKSLGLMQGMYSMVNYGLTDCYYGFGPYLGGGSCTDRAQGRLQFSMDSGTSPEAVIDELAMLLTAGRLSSVNRGIIKDVYSNAANEAEGLKVAQQLVLGSSEFHSTNIIESTNNARSSFTFPDPTGHPYKAIVYIMLSGGADSYNMLVPHTCTKGKDMYEEYLQVRAQVAIPKTSSLPIPASNQVCETFALHPNLTFLQSLYNDGDLALFANTGILTRPVDKNNYSVLTVTNLFAHNHCQEETKRVDPLKASVGTGVLGRMTDALTSYGQNVGSFSVDRFSVAVIGVPGMSPTSMIVNRNGVPNIYISDIILDLIASLNQEIEADSGFFADTWSSSWTESIATSRLLNTALSNTSPTVAFPNNYLGSQLQTVSRLIQTRDERGVDTDTFYVEIGGFDTHSDVEEILVNRFSEINSAVQAFVTEVKSLGLWQNVTTIQVSDFARTLVPNSGDGTDHAWGGNYFMFGGDVNGGQIFGTYPDDLTDEGPLVLGRGRLLPTTSWDAVFNGIASWVGVKDKDLDKVCPNRRNFPMSDLFQRNEIFRVPPPPPTPSPTSSPTTNPPTNSPTISSQPSATPSSRPTRNPSSTPSTIPSTTPSVPPTMKPTVSHEPSSTPSKAPTDIPSTSPSDTPTSMPSISPSDKPSSTPSAPPTKKPTKNPTPGPTPFPTEMKSTECGDSTTYRYKFISTNNCNWVKKNPAFRCYVKDSQGYASNYCLQTCDTCPCVDNNKFAYNGVSWKNCAWIAAAPGSRCKLATVPENCIATCNSPCCKDDLSFRYNGVKSQNCKWVSSSPGGRCGLAGVKEACKVTCKTCVPAKKK